MPLVSGARLGPYEIVGALGAGGMGEVYRARDTRLDRTVALKVLQPQVASDPQFRERFDREARVVSSLEHPNICALYDVGRENGVDFLVMQFLDGQTLAERLTSGPLPLDQALDCAVDVCSALAAAHRRGIVHRDLKPGNVMLTKGGAKLLDFGLAKTTMPVVANVSAGPTWAGPLTAHGTILGTLQYMAPEQLEGKEADPRTDIFAFGVVLYEMLTGRKAFEGSSQASLITAIMSAQPMPIAACQPLAPPAIDHIVRICLAKDPDARFQSAHDMLVDLKWIVEGGSLTAGSGLAVGTPRRARARLGAAAGIAAAAVVASLGTWWLIRPQSAPAPVVVRATVVLPATAAVQAGRFTAANVAISPDGTRIVYAGAAGDGSQLYLRSLDGQEVAPIAGTEDALNPFFSPDGQWVAFFADGKLKKVPVVGGAAQTLCDAEFVFGGAWSADGTIVFGGSLQGGLLRVSSNGGQPEAFTKLDKGDGSHRWPALMPGSRDVLFAVGAGFNWDDARIAVQSLDSTEHRILPDVGTSPRYVPTGHLIFARAGSLFAAPFDLARRATTGPAVLLFQDLSTTALGGNAQYALSTAGTLVYVPGGGEDVRRSLVWVDRKGIADALSGTLRGFEIPRLSPDGERVAVTIREGDADVWIVELRRGMLTRITSEAGEDHSVAWTPDSTRVTYSSTRGEGRSSVMLKAADGSGGQEQLFVADQHTHLGGWTGDGRNLLTDGGNVSTRGGLYSLSIGDRSAPRVYLQTPFNEHDPMPSPDGRWVAYISDESGREEVYVQAFPVPGARTRISSDGGSEPMWARNGREIFYRNGDKMMVVAVEAGSTFRAGLPRVLFEGQYARVVWGQTNYDVSLDGQRFLMIKTEAQPPSTELRLIVNWFAELLRPSP
ncbi:MAG: hypothetical protein A3H97_19275 [Acidobacteria bacterium RIFCSPLOWO2_02_FULL_65_29]|nr:MAG: hypothetical protein A3H97_19275 [Acidobacteria bacterium RIFCSPLOWO2_02_FULL_65_29]